MTTVIKSVTSVNLYSTRKTKKQQKTEVVKEVSKGIYVLKFTTVVLS